MIRLNKVKKSVKTAFFAFKNKGLTVIAIARRDKVRLDRTLSRRA